jgi:hypothetical protein
MNPRTKPTGDAAPYPVSPNDGQTPITGFPGDLQDVCTCGIGEAIELERAWLASIASLNKCALDVYKNAFRSPTLDVYFDTMTKAFASCLELQMNWLGLLLPHASSKVAKDSGSRAQPTEDTSEDAEDFAVETFENY